VRVATLLLVPMMIACSGVDRVVTVPQIANGDVRAIYLSGVPGIEPRHLPPIWIRDGKRIQTVVRFLNARRTEWIEPQTRVFGFSTFWGINTPFELTFYGYGNHEMRFGFWFGQEGVMLLNALTGVPELILGPSNFGEQSSVELCKILGPDIDRILCAGYID
jgi:hypothetical protein